MRQAKWGQEDVVSRSTADLLRWLGNRCSRRLIESKDRALPTGLELVCGHASGYYRPLLLVYK